MTDVIVIAHNLRSTHNVGSLLRTAEGLGVKQVLLTGYTPYPTSPEDDRLPHIAARLHKQISKTALGAETLLAWKHLDTIEAALAVVRAEGYLVAALEQAPHSVPLPEFVAPPKLALIIGREAEGIEPEVLELCDTIIEIPMAGRKESFNVVQAAAMALYQLTLVA